MRLTAMIRSITLLVIWLTATAAVAFVVAREAVQGDASNVLQPVPTITLTDRPTVSLEDVTIIPVVAADARVVRDNDTWLLVASVQPADVAYRLLEPPVGVKARIHGGPAGFDCVWVGLAPSGEGGVAAQCAIPESVSVAEGMTGTMVIQIGESTRVAGLPVTAVIGSEQSGQVIVVADGQCQLRPVTLGVNDDLHVEIVDGLEPGERVLEFPTQLDVYQAQSQ